MSKRLPSPVVFPRYVLEHLVRISRILKQPGGNALLVGVGGSGRQSLSRLAASVSDFHVFQPEISKSYGHIEWREDIKVCINTQLLSFLPPLFLPPSLPPPSLSLSPSLSPSLPRSLPLSLASSLPRSLPPSLSPENCNLK